MHDVLRDGQCQKYTEVGYWWWHKIKFVVVDENPATFASQLARDYDKIIHENKSPYKKQIIHELRWPRSTSRILYQKRLSLHYILFTGDATSTLNRKVNVLKRTIVRVVGLFCIHDNLNRARYLHFLQYEFLPIPYHIFLNRSQHSIQILCPWIFFCEDISNVKFIFTDHI